MSSSRSCRRSATSFSRRRLYSPETFTCMIGNSERLNSTMVGSSAAEGRSGLAMSTFSRTSWSASVMSMPALNSMTMLE